MTPVATTKAVILARGLGTRMRRSDATLLSPEQTRAADAGSKALVNVGRPFLDYVLSALADGGVRDVCIVVAPDDVALRDRYGREPLARLRVTFAEQREARGTADALLAARDFAGYDHTLVLNADNYYPIECIRALVQAGEPAVPAFDRDALVRLGNVDAERVRAYALMRVEKGVLVDLVEKPDQRAFDRMKDAPVSMNIWSVPPDMFDACARVKPSVRGELELPDAVRVAIREFDVRFRAIPFSLGVLDLSQRADIPSVTERLAGVSVSL